MTSHPLARRAVVAAAVVILVPLAAPSAAMGLARGPLNGPNNLRVQAVDSAGNRSPASSVTLTNQTC